MPRHTQTIEDVLRAAASEAVKGIVPTIQRHLAALAAKELENTLADAVPTKSCEPVRQSRKQTRARGRGEEIVKWVADRRARRVPLFVIELTGGLDTKKKIVAKYGENAVFEKGKALPKAT